MARWLVCSPEYSYTEWVCPEGGPIYDVRDCMEIEAASKSDAKALAVRWWLDHPKEGSWVQGQRDEKLNPYEGITVEPYEPEDEEEESRG